MAAHLRETPEKKKRNGKGKKTLKTNIGEVEISSPRDRKSSFEPSIVKKRQTILAANLLKLSGKWGDKYPVVMELLELSWEELSVYFVYIEPMRNIIYTSNAVAGFYRQGRKISKTKDAFTNNMAFLKIVYLATKNIEKKWTSPLQNWSLTIQQLVIKFGDSIALAINAKPSKL
jgi:transposase-like protein